MSVCLGNQIVLIVVVEVATVAEVVHFSPDLESRREWVVF